MKKTLLLFSAILFTLSVANAQSVVATSILPNVNELQNFAGTDVYVYVRGYYVPDDGGGGLFKRQASNLEENGGTVFNVHQDANNKWIRIYEGDDISVKWFGAKGTSTDDDTDKIQKAIYEAQYEGKWVYLPKGQYRTTNSLGIDTNTHRIINNDTISTVVRRLRIRGEEKTLAVIRGDFEGTIFELKMPDGNTLTNMVIRDLTLIDHNRSDGQLVNGIEIKHNQNSLIENMIFRDLRYDIYAESFWSSSIKNCISRVDVVNPNLKNRYYFNRQCNRLLIEGCVLSNTQKHEDYLVVINEESSSITFTSCTFEYGRGVLMENRNATPLTNISFIGCYWEWFQYEAIAIRNLANVRGVNITNNYFNAIHGTNSNEAIKGIHILDADGNVQRTIGYEPNHAILLGGVRGMTITDSYFINWIKNPIYHSGRVLSGGNAYEAEGVNIKMCTWKNVRSDYPLINSAPLNSVINNPPSDKAKPYVPQ